MVGQGSIKFDGYEFTYVEELSSIGIAVIHSNASAANSNIKSNSEISWLKWHLTSVLLDNHLSLEESTLWSSTVRHLWFSNHNASILEVIEDNELANSVVLKSALDNGLLEIAEESQDLNYKVSYTFWFRGYTLTRSIGQRTCLVELVDYLPAYRGAQRLARKEC